jgi:hypothetical protein
VLAVFNYAAEFYTKPELHPIIKQTPNSCEISWSSPDVEQQAAAFAEPRSRVQEMEKLEELEGLAEGGNPDIDQNLEDDPVVRSWQEEMAATSAQVETETETETETEWGEEKRAEEGIKPRLSAWFSDLEVARAKGPPASEGDDFKDPGLELIGDDEDIRLGPASDETEPARNETTADAGKTSGAAGPGSGPDHKEPEDSWQRLEKATKASGRG